MKLSTEGILNLLETNKTKNWLIAILIILAISAFYCFVIYKPKCIDFGYKKAKAEDAIIIKAEQNLFFQKGWDAHKLAYPYSLSEPHIEYRTRIIEKKASSAKVHSTTDSLLINGIPITVDKFDSTLTDSLSTIKFHIEHEKTKKFFNFMVDMSLRKDTEIHNHLVDMPTIPKEKEIKTKTNWTTVWMSDVITACATIFIEGKINHRK